MLDLTSFEKAFQAMIIAIEVYAQNPLPDDAKEKVLLRDGVIQRFEFTFELSWKMLKRYLEEYGLEKTDGMNNRELFRVGYEQGLIGDAEKWFMYLKARNMTSHIYDDTTAAGVFEAAREFPRDAEFLLNNLKDKIA